MIHIRTLGALEVRDANGRELVAVVAQPKRLALLAYLAVTSSQGFQRRDQILALFWPELDNEHARAALNRAIYYVRRAVGEGVLLSRGDDEIGVWGADVWCDAAAFQAAVTQGRSRDALELYKGDLMAGFYISDSPAFERWLDGERERLRVLACRTAWLLAEEEFQGGQPASAVYWARWAVERAPYDEAGVQRLIHFLDEMGDRAGAVHAYEQFARRIADDLELTPAPETEALVESVRQRKQPGAGNGWKLNGNAAAAEPIAVPVLVPTREEGRSKARAGALVVAAAFVLSVAALAINATRREAPRSIRQVVVAAIENRTGDAAVAGLTRVTAQWISQSLTELGTVETVAPRVAAGQRTSQSCEDTRALRRLATEARADLILCGAVYREAGQLRFHAGVLDVSQDAAVWTIAPVTAPLAAPERALREVRDRITGAVAALTNSALASWFQRATAPPTIAAYREYAHALLEREPKDRAAYMRRAATLDSTFTWGALVAAQILLAYDPVQADTLMSALEARRDQLPPAQVHALNGLRARQADDRLAAYDELSIAASLAPRIFLPDFAQAARTLYRPRESLQLLDRFDSLRAIEKRKPNGIVRTELLHQLRDHRRELVVVLQARRDFPRGLQSIYLEVRTRAALGQLPRVRALIDSALSYPREPRYTPGNLMMIAATEFRAHDWPAAEKELLTRAIDWYRANPTAERDSSIYSLAAALYQAGRWDEAEPLFRKMLVKDSVGAPWYLGSLGAIAAHRGDRAAAQQYADSLVTVRFPNQLRAYDGKYERARIKAVLGDTDGALQLLREAAGPQGMDLHAEFDFESLADNPAFKEFTRPKG